MAWLDFLKLRRPAKEKVVSADTPSIMPADSELSIYEPSSKPTKIKKRGMAVSIREDAEKVKAHFLEFDRSYGQLFKNVFDGKLDEIDELNHDAKNGMGSVFAIASGATKINAAYGFFFENIVTFSIDGKRYEFTQPTYTSGLFPKGHYNFFGERLDGKDYRELVEPNAHTGKDEFDGNKIKKSCYRHDDDNGSSGGTIKAEVVPALIKRIISYAKA